MIISQFFLFFSFLSVFCEKTAVITKNDVVFDNTDAPFIAHIGNKISGGSVSIATGALGKITIESNSVAMNAVAEGGTLATGVGNLEGPLSLNGNSITILFPSIVQGKKCMITMDPVDNTLSLKNLFSFPSLALTEISAKNVVLSCTTMIDDITVMNNESINSGVVNNNHQESMLVHSSSVPLLKNSVLVTSEIAGDRPLLHRIFFCNASIDSAQKIGDNDISIGRLGPIVLEAGEHKTVMISAETGTASINTTSGDTAIGNSTNTITLQADQSLFLTMKPLPAYSGQWYLTIDKNGDVFFTGNVVPPVKVADLTITGTTTLAKTTISNGLVSFNDTFHYNTEIYNPLLVMSYIYLFTDTVKPLPVEGYSGILGIDSQGVVRIVDTIPLLENKGTVLFEKNLSATGMTITMNGKRDQTITVETIVCKGAVVNIADHNHNGIAMSAEHIAVHAPALPVTITGGCRINQTGQKKNAIHFESASGIRIGGGNEPGLLFVTPQGQLVVVSDVSSRNAIKQIAKIEGNNTLLITKTPQDIAGNVALLTARIKMLNKRIATLERRAQMLMQQAKTIIK